MFQELVFLMRERAFTKGELTLSEAVKPVQAQMEGVEAVYTGGMLE